jgi:hypothetical protein
MISLERLQLARDVMAQQLTSRRGCERFHLAAWFYEPAEQISCGFRACVIGHLGMNPVAQVAGLWLEGGKSKDIRYRHPGESVVWRGFDAAFEFFGAVGEHELNQIRSFTRPLSHEGVLSRLNKGKGGIKRVIRIIDDLMAQIRTERGVPDVLIVPESDAAGVPVVAGLSNAGAAL